MLGILKEGPISQILHEAKVGKGTSAATVKDRRLERSLQSYHRGRKLFLCLLLVHEFIALL